MLENTLLINTDGGSRGNPGKSACAFYAHVGQKIIKQQSKFIGVSTNNVAEYNGVLLAFQWLVSENVDKFSNIQFLIDSELVVKQLNGVYKIKNPNIQNIILKIKYLEKKLTKSVSYRNVPREENTIADHLVNLELDKH